ncbi:putative DNA replication protein DnaC [Aedoeadaptatus coxii]|uniref:ATP-binding protein n=1 Tax=Aedoeadaptatus coxii TaxID=755172 RepID=UPI001763DFAF|nr:ATP-binding protein [Peptoniphilus coxii]CAC9933381.1 putative DNA replication protein DnaC [Peptoniphilus coxii]
MAHYFDDIRREYDKIRRDNERMASDRREEAYHMVDGLEEVEDNIRSLGYDAARAGLLSGDADVATSAQKELQTLEGIRRSLLLKAGLPADYLDPIYTCPDCKDKGYLEDGTRCHCLERKLTAYLHRGSHIERQIATNNFGNFRMDIFSDMPYGEKNISPRQNMEEILKGVKTFMDTFKEPNDMNLLFYGATGLGKTFLSHAVAAEIMANGVSVVYETAFGMIRICEDKVFNKSGEREAEMAYDSLFTSDLLIIDDLGTEMANAFTIAQFFNILNTRLIEGKKTIISTNLSPREISAVYGDRIFSRIFDKFVPMEFIGEDLRWEADRP